MSIFKCRPKKNHYNLEAMIIINKQVLSTEYQLHTKQNAWQPLCVILRAALQGRQARFSASSCRGDRRSEEPGMPHHHTAPTATPQDRADRSAPRRTCSCMDPWGIGSFQITLETFCSLENLVKYITLCHIRDIGNVIGTSASESFSPSSVIWPLGTSSDELGPILSALRLQSF